MIEYNNNFTREKYDRIGVLVPKDHKAEIKAAADRRGLSMNAYICLAIDELMERDKHNGG